MIISTHEVIQPRKGSQIYRNALLEKLTNPYTRCALSTLPYTRPWPDDDMDVVFAEAYNRVEGRFITVQDVG
jgi:hypothetical protein